MDSSLTNSSHTWSYTALRTHETAQIDAKRNHLVRLSASDAFFLDRPHKMQCIALQYPTVLDPVYLCQSLDDVVTNLFPAVGSHIVSTDGVRYYQLRCEPSRVRLVLVSPQALANPREWHGAFLALQPPVGDTPAPLFRAVLLRCADAAHGSVLLAGFAHVLGDGASYALLLSAW